MEETTNLGLIKPGLDDYVNIADLNNNADIIDAEIDAVKKSVAEKEKVGVAKAAVDALAGAGNKKTVKQLDDSLASHLAEKATLTKVGHVQLNSDIDSTNETKAATPNAIKKVSDKLDNRLNEALPLQYTDQGKTYRWGFRTVNGEPQIIYEEVIA